MWRRRGSALRVWLLFIAACVAVATALRAGGGDSALLDPPAAPNDNAPYTDPPTAADTPTAPAADTVAPDTDATATDAPAAADAPADTTPAAPAAAADTAATDAPAAAIDAPAADTVAPDTAATTEAEPSMSTWFTKDVKAKFPKVQLMGYRPNLGEQPIGTRKSKWFKYSIDRVLIKHFLNDYILAAGAEAVVGGMKRSELVLVSTVQDGPTTAHVITRRDALQATAPKEEVLQGVTMEGPTTDAAEQLAMVTAVGAAGGFDIQPLGVEVSQSGLHQCGPSVAGTHLPYYTSGGVTHRLRPVARLGSGMYVFQKKDDTDKIMEVDSQFANEIGSVATGGTFVLAFSRSKAGLGKLSKWVDERAGFGERCMRYFSFLRYFLKDTDMKDEDYFKSVKSGAANAEAVTGVVRFQVEQDRHQLAETMMTAKLLLPTGVDGAVQVQQLTVDLDTPDCFAKCDDYEWLHYSKGSAAAHRVDFVKLGYHGWSGVVGGAAPDMSTPRWAALQAKLTSVYPTANDFLVFSSKTSCE